MTITLKTLTEVKQHKAINNGERFMIVAMEDNLQWIESELEIFISLWERQTSVYDMANLLERPIHEICYLIIYFDSTNSSKEQQSLFKDYKKKFKRRKHGALDETYHLILRRVANDK